MTETQKRIQVYKDALPGIKERIAAVALLLLLSLSMVTSASFAWLTLSRAPELSNVHTTVASNGNLEVALVAPDGSRPNESLVGDSSAAKGQSVTAANLTWGNLINLSDPVYGLSGLTMRPAQLNTASLLDSPLFGAVYGSDGRITQLSSEFGYAVWNPPTDEKPGYFAVSGDYGVRAISSTTIEAVGAEAQYHRMVSTAKTLNLSAATIYTNLGNNDRYMPSLATMMGLYMTARMNPSHETLSNPECKVEDIANLRDMYKGFLEAFDAEADAIAALLNLQLFLKHGEGNFNPYDRAKVYESSNQKLTAAGLIVSDLDQFKKDRDTIASDYEKLKTLASAGGTLKWKDSGLNNIVNNLVNVGACTIGADNTPISSIGASNASNYLSGTQEARITNGILYRFEERTGGYIEVKELSISATVNRMGMTIPATVKANIQTTASRDYSLFNNDLIATDEMNTGNYEGGIPVAEDTYGLAIDLWVRTNALNSYLTLEGNVLTMPVEKDVLTTTSDGTQVPVYVVEETFTGENGEEVTISTDLYQKTNADGSVHWYNANNHVEHTLQEGATPVKKIEIVDVVIGYEGENRVWDTNQKEHLSVDSTTQGSGSCYVYYADTPEDQARSLALLDAFNVAFVDGEGRLLAEAIMDTQNYFAENGRVIVPLTLSTSNSVLIGTDMEGNNLYAITPLEQNVATRITAIVYLDGTKLTNDEVLAAADIQGQLNIQFGSSETLEPIDNEKLEYKALRVTASADKNSFDYDTATDPMTVNVSVIVDGDAPKNVSAFFIRKISATQGSRETAMTFTGSDASWSGSYTFTSPGEYTLRTVRLDGVDYDLAEPVTVVVNGFGISSLSCQQAINNHVSVMSAAASTNVDLTLKFASSDVNKLPKKVQGRYLRDDDGSAVNVDFVLNPTTQEWSGSATFRTSGTYTLQYLVLDGEYKELDPAMWQTATVTLGMRVAIYTTSPHSFMYKGSSMDENQKLLHMQVKIFDNAGNERGGMDDVTLTFAMKGNSLRTMNTDLEWDGTYYSGDLTTLGPGTWQFANVKVGGNILTSATTSPTFTIYSPNPPEYYGHDTEGYQYKPDKTATMNAQITNSSAATVAARIENSSGYSAWVNGSMGENFATPEGEDANNWTFTVPTTAEGFQDGNWTMKEIKIWNVFASDGTAYTEEAPLTLDVDDNNVSRVINRVIVSFPQGLSKNFGKEANGNVTGNFMQSHTISGLSVDIRDFEGKLIDGVKDVKLTFSYVNGSSRDYGGYTSESLNNATVGATVIVDLKPDAAGTHFTQEKDVTLLFAGEYHTTFTYTVGGTTYTYSNIPNSGHLELITNTPKYTVSSITPSVKITGAYYGAKGSDGASSFTDTATTVYYRETTEKSCGITYYNYQPANVTITLSGYGNATGAKLEFTTSNSDGKVHLYEASQRDDGTSTNAYVWTANGTCQRYMGWWESKTGDDEKAPAGTLTATKLTLTYNNVTYDVDITDIVIKNPS